MSNYYLCARCKNNPNDSWVGIVIECTEMGATRAKVMVDHGHSGGRRPYDEPLDVCPHFKLRVDA